MKSRKISLFFLYIVAPVAIIAGLFSGFPWFIEIVIVLAYSLNGVVVFANGHYMPVRDKYYEEKLREVKKTTISKGIHRYYQNKEDIKLFYLADIIPLKFGKHRLLISIGDIVISLAVILIIIY